MMSYELFKNIVASRFKEFLPGELQESEIQLRTVRKVNQIMDCMNLVPPDGGAKITPNIYINEMYKEFQKCEDLDKVLRKTAVTAYYAMQSINPEITKIDFAQWTNNIVINLVNTEENQELLEELPHREVLDLSVIYRFIMGQNKSGLATIKVDNGLMDEIGLTEEELFHLALENTRRMFPIITEPLDKIKEQAEAAESEAGGTKTCGFAPNENNERNPNGWSGKELCEKVPEDDPPRDQVKNQIQFMTNSLHLHGASSILFEDELHALAEKMESGFYVMPSSVHEVVAVSEKLGQPEVLEMMLREANKQDFVGVNKLSDRVYYYNKEKRTLSFAC